MMWHILAFHLFQINPGHEMDTLHFKGKSRGSKSTRSFGWKPKNQGNFLAWRAWDKLCHPRSLSGLSFKKAKEINNALIAKLAWMIVSKRDSLCMDILRAKYKVKQDWLQTDPHRNASPIWKAIKQAKKVIVKGACYIIGDGTSIICGKILGSCGYKASFPVIKKG